MIAPYLTIFAMLVLILFPVIVPGLITLVHTITEPKANRRLRTA